MNTARTFLHALKALAVPLVLCLLFLVLRHIGFGRILEAAGRMEWTAVGSAAALFMAMFLLWCLRWQQLMPRSDRRSVAALLPIYMAGVFGNVVTPGARVGGEPIRAYYMSRAFGGEKTAHLGTILADKISNGAVFLLFLMATVNFVVLFVGIGLYSKLAMEVGVLLVVAAAVTLVILRRQVVKGAVLALRRLLPLLYRSRPMGILRLRFATCAEFEEYLTRKVRNISAPIARMAGSTTALLTAFLLSAVAWLLFCLAHYMLFRGLGADTGYLRVVAIVTISTFIGDISVSPGGAGVMETAMIALCAAFGISPGEAAAVTLISRVLFYTYGIGLGGLCLVGLSLRYGRAVEEAGEDAEPKPPAPDPAGAA
ncbi:MAG: flippase-like domain-containing protein [Candidatus Brocadiaceae bacterium]|mgnify:CR=1 FL=1|nr:flippase-like domain-containing protein [Candidatus Brocadiaceae bacterium]